MPAPKKPEPPCVLAITALEALAGYKASGLAMKGEKMHEELAKRLVRVVRTDNWQG
jgi:hypothetical protein